MYITCTSPTTGGVRGVDHLLLDHDLRLYIYPSGAHPHTHTQSPSPQEVRVSLREMVGASQRLRSECTMVSHSDIALRTRQIINSAYDVAKAARHLVLCCEQDHQ